MTDLPAAFAFASGSAPIHAVARPLGFLQRTDEFTHAGPGNLDAQTEQDEGRQPDKNIRTGGSEYTLDVVRIGKANVDRGRYDDSCGESGNEKFKRVEIDRVGKSNADHDRYGAGASRERQRQWIKGLLGKIGSAFGLDVTGGLRAALVQKSPACDSDDEAAGNSENRN